MFGYRKKIKSFGQTDRGLVRQHNEDAFLINDKKHFYAVCDGLGGHVGGEVASHIAVDYFCKNINLLGLDDKKKALHDLIFFANQTIYEKSQSDFKLEGMATTVVSVLFNDNKIFIAHVGDSRAYFITKQEIIRLTKDHSWIQEEVELNHISQEQADRHYQRNILTRALGDVSDVKVDIDVLDIKNGLILLCSDGLTDLILDSRIKELVLSNNSLPKISQSLINEAKLNGGSDNITVIIIKIS